MPRQNGADASSALAVAYGEAAPPIAAVWPVSAAITLSVVVVPASPSLSGPPSASTRPGISWPSSPVAMATSASKLSSPLPAATSPQLTTDQLSNYFRGVLLTKAKDYIAETIVKKKINLLEISAYLEDMSTAIGDKLNGEFAKFGVRLVNFYLNSVDVPEDDETVIRLKKALSDRAEVDIMGDKYQQKRTLDVMEKAAGNTGGGAGAGMGLGAGMGMGMGMGQMMAGAMGNLNQGGSAPAAGAAGAAGAKFCVSCGKPLAPAGKFCADCGAKVG